MDVIIVIKLFHQVLGLSSYVDISLTTVLYGQETVMFCFNTVLTLILLYYMNVYFIKLLAT